MNWKKRIVNMIFRDEVQALREVIGEVSSDWQMIPYTLQRQAALTGMISELDPQLYDFLLRQQRDYQLINNSGMDETYRQAIVKQSRAMYLTSPVISFGVKTWTDFGFGESPNLTAEDKKAQETWDEFFTADRNAPVLGARKLHKQSDTLLVDGEVFFAIFASEVDGEATLRTIPTDEIKELVKDPQDKNVVLFYRRDFAGEGGEMLSLYYKDWAATDEQLARAKLPQDAKRADVTGQINQPGTDVKILQAAFRERNGRGWPLASTGMDWEIAYSGFLKDRAAVAKAAASVVEKVKVKGGQRAVDAVRASIGTSITGSTDSYERNPPPVAGATWIENDALTREWMNRPTGAADAEKDGIPLITQVGLALGLFPHYLGRGDYYRLATATAMETPVLKSFSRYQNFWSSIWRDMFKIVTGYAQSYGGKSFSSQDCKVSTDRIISLSEDDIAKTVTALNDMVDRAIIDSTTAQAIGRTLMQTALETMGLQNIQVNPEPTAETFFTPERAKEVFEAWLEASKGKGAGESHSPFRGR